MKTQCLQTNKTHHYSGKENAWEAGWVRKRGSINEKFNLREIQKTCLRCVLKDRAKFVSWYNQLCIFFQFRYIEIELSPYGHHKVLLLDGVHNAIAKLLPIHYEATIGEFWLKLYYQWHHVLKCRGSMIKHAWL